MTGCSLGWSTTHSTDVTQNTARRAPFSLTALQAPSVLVAGFDTSWLTCTATAYRVEN